MKGIIRTSPRPWWVASLSMSRSVSMPCSGSTTAEGRKVPGKACTISSKGSGLCASIVMIARSTPAALIWLSSSGKRPGIEDLLLALEVVAGDPDQELGAEIGEPDGDVQPAVDGGWSHRSPRDARVDELADALDGRVDHLALLQIAPRRPHRADAGRRAREDEVAGLERAEARQERYQLRHREDHVGGARVLEPLAAHLAGDLEVVRIAKRIQRGNGRSDRPEAVERLAERELWRPVAELQLTLGDVLTGAVPGHHVERALRGDALHAPADHDHQLRLVIDVPRRDRDVGAGAREAVRELREHHRCLRDLEAGLLGVRAVVEPDRQHLCRTGDGWTEANRIGELLEAAGRQPRGPFPQRVPCPERRHGIGREPAAGDALDVEEAIAVHELRATVERGQSGDHARV